MLIRPINESDNKFLSVLLREVLIEMQIPKKGSAYEDPELDNMFSTYQLPRSKYFVVEERGAILGGAGISPLKGGDKDICELQKMYFHKSLRGRGIGDKMIEICNKGHINATDIADALVADLGVPFRDAHMITGKLVAIADRKKIQIHELNIKDFKKVDKRISKNIVNKIIQEN